MCFVYVILYVTCIRFPIYLHRCHPAHLLRVNPILGG